MTELSEKLKEDIVNELVEGKLDKTWIEGEIDYNLSNSCGIEIELNPENAEKINEVKSFTISEDVTGAVSTVYNRKPT